MTLTQTLALLDLALSIWMLGVGFGYFRLKRNEHAHQRFVQTYGWLFKIGGACGILVAMQWLLAPA